MKKTIVFLVSALLYVNAFSQDWAFIKPNERYHFQHTDDEIPLNTVFIDSATLIDGDSLYYLNRLFQVCDTCALDTNDFGDTLLTYLDNQPVFLQREFAYSQVSGTIEMRNPYKYTLYLPGKNIEEWWFDEAENMKATVHKLSEENVFGVIDSVVSYAINGKPKIKLSKNYGLIEYFDYELAGLENAELGQILPTWNDFYDFEVGDVFIYYGSNYTFSMPCCPYIEKLTIKEKYYDNGTFSYLVSKMSIGGEIWFEPVENRIVFDTSRLNIYEVYHVSQVEELLDCNNLFTHELYPFNGVNSIYSFYNIANYIKSDSEISLILGDSVMQRENTYESLDGVFKPNDNLFSFYAKYTPGLGQTGYEMHDLNNFNEFTRYLIGYVKNGVDTTGTVFDDKFFLEPNDTTGIFRNDIINFKVYPNPSTGQFSIDMGVEEQVRVNIYNLQGQIIESFVVGNKEIMDLSYLNAGIYLVKVNGKKGVQQQKWVKQ